MNVPGGIYIELFGNMVIKKVSCGPNDIFGVGVNAFSQDQQEFMILEIFQSGLIHHYLSVMVAILFD